jgi:hypothetical protein
MAKRCLNWTEIEARYKAGEKPAHIAKDYRDCTRQKISQKATREGWTQSRQIIRHQIVEAVAEATIKNALLTRERLLEELCHIAYQDMKNCADIEEGGGITLKTFEQMPDGASRAIKKLKEKRKILEPTEGDGKSVLMESQMEFGHHDKIKAIELMAKMLGFDKPEEDQEDASEESFTLHIRKGSDTNAGA